MIPFGDVNPTRRRPILTYLLIVANIVDFAWQLSLTEDDMERIFYTHSVVPIVVSHNLFTWDTFLDIFRSMFFHGSLLHIGGNMLYLYIFGDNIEDRFGRFWYLFLYIVSGFSAALAQVAVDPNSPIPLIGASGAIAGVLGSYVLLYPGAKVRGILFLGIFARLTVLPAWIVLGFWFALQVFSGVMGLGMEANGEGGVAFFAHIGGFVAGVVLTVFLRTIKSDPRDEIYDIPGRYGLQ